MQICQTCHQEIPQERLEALPEVAPFVNDFGATWVETPTLENLASVVLGADIVVCNQSCVVALAVGLGKKRILDGCSWFPSNDFVGPNHFVMSVDGDENLAILKAHL